MKKVRIAINGVGFDLQYKILNGEFIVYSLINDGNDECKGLFQLEEIELAARRHDVDTTVDAEIVYPPKLLNAFQRWWNRNFTFQQQ